MNPVHASCSASVCLDSKEICQVVAAKNHTGIANKDPQKNNQQKIMGKKYPLQGTKYIKLYVFTLSENSPFSNHQLPAVATKLVKLRLGLRSIGVSSTIPLANLSPAVSGENEKVVKGSATNRKLPPRFHGKN